MSIDYHGFTESDGEPLFVFGSRNTSVVTNSARNGYIINDENDKQNLLDFFDQTDHDDLLKIWFDVHADVCKYFGDSHQRPVRFCNMTLILQPLHHGIFKHHE